jgi:hypothetical protein
MNKSNGFSFYNAQFFIIYIILVINLTYVNIRIAGVFLLYRHKRVC